jgi:HK97 gp10 family phage protein
MRITIALTGLDSLALAVGYMKTAAQTGLKLGVSEAAGLIEAEAKAIVPVETGNLRDAIHTEQTVDEPETQVQTVSPAVEAGNKWGFDPAYARRIEFGFVGQDSLGRHYHQAAQPYMRPAYETQKQPAIDAVRDSLYQELDAVVGGK